jgi:hypothetical protein
MDTNVLIDGICSSFGSMHRAWLKTRWSFVLWITIKREGLFKDLNEFTVHSQENTSISRAVKAQS